MLSGEGNKNDDKTKIRLIGKNTSLHVQHTFFVHFFAVVLHDNVKLPSYAFYGGNVVRVFFFHCRSFSPWWPLGFLILSPPLQNFHVVLPTINGSLSLALALCGLLFFSDELRWSFSYFLFFSVFLLLYIPNLLT